MIHELKLDTTVFDYVKCGHKTFEFRKSNRNFRPADTVVLKEWLPNLAQYTGEQVTAKIGFVLHGPAYGVPDGYCIF